ncbi:ABC transporter substrate-binding protein [Devosia pacifica]|uniref:ABC transporter substrate-binding protein n=1 Tax=Devosia pacifica TaxID=1335967 RepID=A0A918VTQ4_9HYPH|nr:extracellular solute-binding protein [Devosia pacifica]GHA21874.1 ABC transporter substrate-binding protein [Devosia pacifica]
MTKPWLKTMAVLSAGLITVLPAIAQDTANTEISGDISVWTWPNNDRTFEALLPAFAEAYPNINVEIQGYPTANDAYLNTLQRGMLSGSGPDVAMIEIGMMALLRDRPQWVDLSQEPYNAGEMLGDFAEFTVNNVTLDDGKVVAMPKHTGPGGMFYRRDIFEEVGLPTDPEAISELFSDWDAFIEEGQKLVVPNERWVIGNGEEIVRAMMAQAGVSYFDEEGNLQFDHPVFREALEKVEVAADAGMISPFAAWTPEWQGAFQRGQLATVMYGNWFGGLLKRAYAADQEGLWGVASAPALEGNRSFNSGGDYIGILETSDNKEAAWAFVKWIVSDEASLKQQFQSDDLYPAYNPAGDADWMNFEDPYYDGQNVNEIFAPAQKELIPFVLHPLDSVAANAMRTAVDNIARDIMSVDEALASAKETVQARM